MATGGATGYYAEDDGDGRQGYDDDDGGDGRQWRDNDDKGDDDGATMTTMTMNAMA